MEAQIEKYRTMLNSETRLMCELLSSGFDHSTFNAEKSLHLYNPKKLLNELTKHRLYPSFYKVWLNTGAHWQEPNWQNFTIALKLLVDNNRFQMLQKTAVLVKLVKAFEQENIPLIALKGPALAQRLFGNYAMRYSWDTDVLVSPENLDKATEILLQLGYGFSPYNGNFTKKQKHYCRVHFQHFTFLHPQSHECIELHWELPQLKILVPDLVPNIWDTMETIKIAGTTVNILSPSLEFAYMAAHGAGHSFYRLAWLYDITNAVKMNPELCNSLSDGNSINSKLINTTLAFSNIVFHHPLVVKHPINRLFIKHCIHTINSIGEKAYKPIIIREYWGKVLLLPGIILKARIYNPLFTSPRDWDMFRLPDRLFFIYFLLRPVLFLMRAIRK